MATYAMPAVCWKRRDLFRRDVHAELFLQNLFRYREQERFLLHGFVVMPEHVHVLLTPAESMEKAAQLVKGGFSFAVRKQFTGEVWQQGYFAHRVVDRTDYVNQLAYISENPEKRRIADWRYVHTRCLERMDGVPARFISRPAMVRGGP